VFPNTTLNVTVSESQASASVWGAGNPTAHATGGQSNTGFTHWAMSWQGTSWVNQSATCMWHAVGF
jgi:hypothetical protein